jgi:hypothetical protein
MKKLFGYSLLGGLVLAAMPAWLHASSPTHASTTVRGRCIGYFPAVRQQGALDPQQAQEAFQWTTKCTSSFSASSTGLATIFVQEFAKGRWSNVTSGISAYVANLGPGTYRIVVKNETLRRIDYSLRHKRGMG